MPLLDYTLPGVRPDREMALTERQLLQLVVECVRSAFNAAAASVFLIDAGNGDLIFEAVAGEGAGHLPGSRFPARTGIVGWVAASAEPMVVDDLAASSLFAQDAAQSTGYVPSSLMAAPLIRGGNCIGVLEVLDSAAAGRGQLADLDLLGLLGTQAAVCLELLVGAQQVGADASARDRSQLLDRIDCGLQAADPATASVAAKLLDAVDDLLGRPGDGGGHDRPVPA